MEMNYASNSKADAALATGVVGTVLGGLNALGNGGSLLGGLGGNGAAGAALMAGVAGHALGSGNYGRCGDHYVTRGEFELAQKISTLEMEKAILEANKESEAKMVDVYRQSRSELKAFMDKADVRYDAQNAWNAQQMCNNAHMSDAIAANRASIDALKGITKIVVPNTAICPGWGGVTIRPDVPEP